MKARSEGQGRTDAPLRVLFVTPEALPYYQSGGLAEVSRALPDALSKLGHQVRVFHPFYSGVDRARYRLRTDEPLTIPWVGGSVTLEMFVHEARGSAHAVLPRHPAFTVSGSPYDDVDTSATGRRFALFARAAVHYAHAWGADIMHLNDWPSALVPAYGLVDNISIPTLFSIHNVAYQGLFTPWILAETGLPRELYRTENGLEFYGQVSFLKGGIALATRLATVSPTYAREIQTPEYGAGFDGLLRSRSRDLVGILNGIDTRAWNPASDEVLSQKYDAKSLAIKDELRGALLAEAGLDTTRPLLAIVSRLAYQKGIDLVLGAMPDLLESGVNLFVLGDGDPGLETHFAELARRMPERVTAVSHFDNGLAHRLYAGADFLLMPSRYEPCGLGQMIAQRYGTPPIVRATGGLRDTVQDGVTGFCFERAAVPDLVAAVRRALTMRRGRQWDILRRRCMAVNWSWSASAQQYADAYDHALGPSEVDRIV